MYIFFSKLYNNKLAHILHFAIHIANRLFINVLVCLIILGSSKLVAQNLDSYDNHLKLNFNIHGISGPHNDYIKTLAFTDNYLWALGEAGFYKFDGSNFNLYYEFDIEQLGFRPYKMIVDNNSGIWLFDRKVDRSTKEVAYLNLETKSIENEGKDEMIDLLKNSETIYNDDNGNMWIQSDSTTFIKYSQPSTDTLKLDQRYHSAHILEVGDLNYVLTDQGAFLYGDTSKSLIGNIKETIIKIEKGDKYDFHVYSTSGVPKSHKLFLVKDNEIKDSFAFKTKNGMAQEKIMFHHPTSQVIFTKDKELLTTDAYSKKASALRSTFFKSLFPFKDKLGNIFLPSQDGVVSITSKKYPFTFLNRSSVRSIRHITQKNDSIILYASYSGHFEYNLKTHEEVNVNEDIISYSKAEIDDNLHILSNSSLHLTLRQDLESGGSEFSKLVSSGSKIQSRIHLLEYDKAHERIWITDRFSNIYYAYLDGKKLTINKYILDTIAEIHDLSFFNQNLIISHDKGLTRIDENLKPHEIEFSNAGIKSCQGISSTANELIVGANDGIYVFDYEFNQLDFYGENIKLNSFLFYTIERDQNGNIWSGTNKGLLYVDRNTKNFIVYDNQTIVGQLDFNYESSYLADDGTLYFGGVSRLVKFHPDSIMAAINKNSSGLTLYDAMTRTWNSDSYMHVEDLDNLFIDDKNPEIKLVITSGDPLSFSTEYLEYKTSDTDTWKRIQNSSLDFKEFEYGKNIVSVRNKLFPSEILEVPIVAKSPFYLRTWFIILWVLFALGLFNLLNLIKNRRLTKANNHLEEQVALRTKEIKEQNIALNISNQSKDKIFSVLAHDLRSPISNLVNISETVDFLVNNDRTSELKLLSGQLQARTNELTYLIDNLLHWSLQQQGKTYFIENNFKIIGPIQETVNQFNALIDKKKIIVKTDVSEEHSIITDYGAFQAVVRNLIHNAIKYSFEDGIIKISSARENGSLKLMFQDQGVGMTMDQIKNLKQGVYISTRGSNNEKGTGIGFTLSNYFAQKMHGNISIKSSDAQGTCFTLTLPVRPPDTTS